jgi:hypothetical protein
MNRLFKLCTVVALAMLVAAPALADDDAKKKKRKKGKPAAGRSAGAQLMKRLEKAEITDEQKGKIKEIVAKYSAQLQEASKAVAAVIGAEGRKKMAAASKKAREAGKKGKEAQAAAMAALGLSDADLAKFKEAQAQVGKVRSSLTKEVAALLTPEQRQKAGLGGRKGNRKKDAPKKKKDA